MNAYMIAGAIAVVLILLKKSGVPVPSLPPVVLDGKRVWTADDRDILARILTSETGGDEKHAATGVAWVVVNRALQKNKSIRDVVVAESFTGGGEKAAEYRVALVAPSGFVGPKFGKKSPLDLWGYAACVKLANAVLDGQKPSPIGDLTGYTHPANFKNQNAALSEAEKNGLKSGSLVWFKGKLCPAWNVLKNDGGKAVAVVEIGDARFSK